MINLTIGLVLLICSGFFLVLRPREDPPKEKKHKEPVTRATTPDDLGTVITTNPSITIPPKNGWPK